ncbi:MAG: LytR C-terminal domain-containing protein [Patescibacteria group bacterium]|nr:LytR C-terminal domain-containing protein [Patescibacteria group bacterium]
MRRKKTHDSKNNLKIALGFFIAVLFFILTAFTFRLVSFFKASVFDGAHNFNVLIYKEKFFFDIVSFAPDAQSLSILKVQGDVDRQSLGKYLGIPIDGEIKLSSDKDFSEIRENKDVEKALNNYFFKFNKIETNLTVLDIGKLWIFTKKVSPVSINFKEVVVSKSDASKEFAIDKLMSDLFNDKSISDEKVSIQIINSTGVSGLGNRLARLVTNIGGNIVAVNTADDVSSISEISYSGDRSYTVKRLAKILGYKDTKKENGGISDIVIRIGKDSLSSNIF